VLVVEDHSDTRNVLELLLKRCGCQTVAAKNVNTARTRLSEMKFDILISDLICPTAMELILCAKRNSIKA